MGKASFSEEEWEVFCRMLAATESGGQVYGNGDWGNFTEAYANTSNEHAITLAAYQFFATEAHQLIELIQKKYPEVFKKYDNAGIAEDLKASDWSRYQISKNSAKAKAIVNMISSTEGIKCQKELVKNNSQKLLEYAYSLGVTDHKALAMAIQIAHLGGQSALKRIINKAKTPYTVASIDAALRTDNQSGTQVGAKLFRSRHDCFIKWIDQYWPTESSSTNNTNNSTDNKTNTGGNNMAKTYPAGYIANSGHDENNSYHGGRAGDQLGGTGNEEFGLRSWYNRPWTHILHYPDAAVRKTIAELGIEAALNDHIGYDQYERTTFWYQLAKVGYRPKNITVNCEQDCSAGATALCKAAGYIHNIKGLMDLSPDNYTGSMVSAFRAAGFEIRTASKYLTSPDYVCAGDILLNESHHAATCISSGSKTGEAPTTYDGKAITSGGGSGTDTGSSGGSLNETVKSYVYANKSSVALRTWAGKSNSQLKSYPTVNKNQKLGLCDTVKAEDGSTWYFVKIDDKYGFVDSADVSKTEVNIDSASSKPSTNTEKYITIEGQKMTVSNGKSFNTKTRKWIGKCNANELNCRQWAGTDADKLVSVPVIKKGTKVYVYDVLLDSSGDPWLYVKIKNPTTGKYVWGFVFASYIIKV